MEFREKNIAMIQSKHCDELIETMRWFKSFIAMDNRMSWYVVTKWN